MEQAGDAGDGMGLLEYLLELGSTTARDLQVQVQVQVTWILLRHRLILHMYIIIWMQC